MTARLEPLGLTRDCPAIVIPSGQPVTLPEGSRVLVVQTLGGSFTVRTDRGWLARIAERDADALGYQPVSPGQNPPGRSEQFDLEAVIDELRGVYDPEIPINVVDLGLIYACDAHQAPGGQRVGIKMSMTAPGCGMGDVLKADAEARVATVPGVVEVDVELVWDPPWTMARMSEAARLELGLY
ncbi:MAG: putative Fe-S cluster assembly protein SufT [Acidimicrobiales bacterium]